MVLIIIQNCNHLFQENSNDPPRTPTRHHRPATMPPSSSQDRLRKSTAFFTAVFGTAIALLYTTSYVSAQEDSGDRLKVVTTFTVLADMAQNVAGEAADVVSVTRAGAEIHGYQPTPGDLRRSVDADLILWNGLNLELWFEQFLDNLGDVPSVTLTEGIDPISIASGSYEGLDQSPRLDGSGQRTRLCRQHRARLERSGSGECSESMQPTPPLTRNRSKRPSRHCGKKSLSIPDDQRWLVTCEGAFSYLARDFGMKELYLWPMNADAVGTPQQVRRVIDTVHEENIPVVFCESTVNTDPARQVARETGAVYGGELYVDSLSEADGPGSDLS